MKRFFVFLSLVFLFVSCKNEPSDINSGWTFWRDSDSVKEIVDLPHDAMIHGKRSADAPGGDAVGYYTGDSYHYEKTINVPSEWISKHVTLTFGGVYRDASVYVNEALVAQNNYGYGEFTVCLDGAIKEGENILRVDCSNADLLDSRWYSGAGIYRKVSLDVKEKDYIGSVHVRTVSYDPAVIEVKTDHLSGDVHVDILKGGKVVASSDGDSLVLDIPNAQLWGPDSPSLYHVKASLNVGDKVTDVYEDDFGIRELKWNSDGLFLNGESILLKGACLHADNGILGMAEYQDAADRKVEILKKYGYNAIRSAHHPCSEEMLRACDRLGMLLMDELWDMWFTPKNVNDYSNHWRDNHLSDIEAMVNKDYNHPSVVMYSIGNEVSEPVKDGGPEAERAVIDALHSLDPTRPTTAGMSLLILSATESLKDFGMDFSQFVSMMGSGKDKIDSKVYNNIMNTLGPTIFGAGLAGDACDKSISPVMDMLDVAGYNYGLVRYPIDVEKHPQRLIVGSETYQRELWDAWALVKNNKSLVGDFVWTAIDYLGETGIGTWAYTKRTAAGWPYPWKLADSGNLDITAHPTGQAFLSIVTWEDTPSRPYLAVMPVSEIDPVSKSQWRLSNSIPSWSWRGKDGVTAHVEAYSSADSVRFILNDETVAVSPVEKGIARADIAYVPGTIVAEAFMADGTKCGRDELCSATGNLSLSVKPEKTSVSEGGLVYIDIEIVGENGIVESLADRKISIEVEGGKLLAYGSALPDTEDSFDDTSYTSYYGRTQAVVLATKKGKIKVTAQGEGLSSASCTVTCR